MKHLTAIFFILAFAILGCKKECKIRHGNDDVQILQPGSFDEIFLNGRMDVSLVQDSSHRVWLAGNSAQFEGVSVTLKNRQLHIVNNNACRIFRGYGGDNIRMKIGVSTLQKINMTLPGKLTCVDTLHGNSVIVEIFDCSGEACLLLDYHKVEAINIKGAADLVLRGKTQKLYLRNEDKGYIHARELEAYHTEITQDGLGDIHACADSTLMITVNNKGKVYHRGHAVPYIRYGKTGKGNIIRE